VTSSRGAPRPALVPTGTTPARGGGSPGDGPPPEGAPWDAPLGEAPLAFVDLEMTGLEVGRDRVVEVCVERVRDGALEDRLETVVNPGDQRGAEHVHGISEAEIAAAPGMATIADRIVELLRGAIVIAHGVSWDLAFLRDEMSRLGRGDEVPTHAIDTIALARRALNLRSYGLSAVARAFELPEDRAHRAGADVRTTRRIFERLLPGLSPKTPRDLWEVRVGERVPRSEVLAAVGAAVAAGAPVTVVYRPSHRAAEPLRMVLTALDPPHAIGYLLPSRGRRLLRLDRILRIEPDAAP
jgi:DNA polymerase-3 subunit epsilon